MVAGLAAALVALLAVGCTSGGGSSTAATSSETTFHEIGPASTEVFGGLTVRLVFEELTVESGDQLPNRLQAENTPGRTVTDPGCVLGASASAIIPADDPGADLGPVVTVDCGGPSDFPDGFSDEWDGPYLVAATFEGDPLPPGD